MTRPKFGPWLPRKPPPPQTALPLEVRFNKYWMPEPNSGCWLWTASCLKDRDGKDSYGVLGFKAKRTMLAHRVSWLLHRGAIPKGLCLLHKCDNKLCVNPDHLRTGTYAENNADMKAKGRASKGSRHHHAKINEATARAIRNAQGTLINIATRFGVSQSCVRDIRVGATWRHA